MKANFIFTLSLVFVVSQSYTQDKNLTLVSPVGQDAVISYFHQFPDSPDGKRLVFTIFKDNQTSDIVVKDLEKQEFYTVNTVSGANRHSGAYPLWIDNETLAYHNSNQDNTIFIHNIVTGKIDEYQGSQISDYSSVNNKILYKTRSENVGEKHIYVIDLTTKTTSPLISIEDVQHFKEEMGAEIPVKQWNFDHPYWSPDGKKIMFQIKAKLRNDKGKAVKRVANLFFADADGSNITFAGPKPMHVQWWDNENFFGYETDNKGPHHMNIYDQQGNVVIEDITGHGNHGTVSPNREWIVTDTWYRTDPIKVHVYKKGETSPTKLLFQQPNIVNGKNFWDVHSHIHPAFSRDGKKVYFNGMSSDGLSKVWCYDLTEIIEKEGK